MNGGLDRRAFLALLTAATIVQQQADEEGSPPEYSRNDNRRSSIGTVYDEIIREESVDDLVEPEDPPAFAITEQGAWEWSADADEWERVPISADTLAPRDDDPVPVFGDLDIQEHEISSASSVDATQISSATFLQHIDPDTEDPAQSIVNRPLATTAPIELFVDPDNGDDDNSGEESEPIATLQEALNRLPFILQHEVRIELADGTYDDHQSGIHTTPHIITKLKAGNIDQSEAFHVVGDPEDPSNVYFTDVPKFNFSFLGTAIHRTVIEGLELDCSIANYGGRMSVRNCIINGNERDLSGITGYQSHTRVDSCTFTDGLNHAVGPGNMGRAIVNDCDGHVAEYVFDPRTGGQVVDRGNEITATYGLYDTRTMDSGGTYQRSAGVIPTENAVLCDDFGDGRLFDRRISTTGTYRPKWRDPGGENPVVEDGYLVFQKSALDRIEIDRTASSPPGVEGQWLYTTGEWTVDYRFEFDGESNGVIAVHLINDGSRNGWHVRLWSDQIELRKRDDGELSTVAQVDVDEDSERHSVSIERSPADEWTITGDEEELTTVTDSYLPEVKEQTVFEITGRDFDNDDEHAELHNVAFYNR